MEDIVAGRHWARVARRPVDRVQRLRLSSIHHSGEEPPASGPVFRRLPGESAWAGLVERIAQRDENSLAALFDGTHRAVYAAALRILGNAEDAEEVTLDVYNQVWRTARSFEAGRGTVMAWLLTLARTRSLDKLRSRAVRMRRVEELKAGFDAAAGGADPEQQSACSEQRSIVQAALGRLPAEQRQALELAFFSGLSHAELAEALGEPLGTVKTRIRLGMMKLRDYLNIGGAAGQEAGA